MNALGNAVQGRGLFTGEDASVTFVPWPDGLWLTLAEHNIGCACLVGAVHPTPQLANVPPGFPVRNTTLRIGEYHAATVEHVLSACAGLNIWNARLLLTGTELPIRDGSALDFVTLLQQLIAAGTLTTGNITPLRLREPIRTASPDNPDIHIIAEPSDELCYTYNLRYPSSSGLPHQSATWDGTAEHYITTVARARTFSFKSEVTMARAAGLFQSFTPKDLPVINADGTLIDNAWRSPNEAAAHKLLDLIGDLALLGAPLIAKVTATGTGHALTHAFSRAVRASLRGNA
jgi:UDP-3-O-[3-hydroxymyristoyl] N-acetylglucosamine deacetylase